VAAELIDVKRLGPILIDHRQLGKLDVHCRPSSVCE
jgi:hypothetical protein